MLKCPKCELIMEILISVQVNTRSIYQFSYVAFVVYVLSYLMYPLAFFIRQRKYCDYYTMILWNQLPCICFLNHSHQTTVSSGFSIILMWQFFQICFFFFIFVAFVPTSAAVISNHLYHFVLTFMYCIRSTPIWYFLVFCDKVLSWWYIDCFGPNSLEHSKSQVGNKWFTWTLSSQMFFF